MKRILFGFGALALIFVLAACNTTFNPGQPAINPEHFGGQLGFGDIIDDGHDDHVHFDDGSRDLSAPLIAHDLATAGIVSSGPTAKTSKNIDARGLGVRDVAGATTDVWAHDGYAYTGTFNSPCGGDPDAGIWIWDVHNKNKADFVGIIPSPVGSRTNDVRVAAMNSGDILVHSNEACAGGPCAFEIYNVDDPTNPVYLASVQTDDVNLFLQADFGFVDFGVHNLWLFTQDNKDYVAATVESLFGNFQIFDITDPTNPTLAGFWGAEQLAFPDIDWVNTVDFVGEILPGNSFLTTGFGASANKFLHDVTVSADGTMAYLANWDAGLVLLDISDPANPSVVSVAIDPVNGSLDGEVNSHSVWPSEDGTIVVEGEEDFSAWEATIPPSNVTFGNGNPIPGVMAGTSFGDLIEANQTGNAGRVYADHIDIESGPDTGEYPAYEFSGNNFPLGGGSVSGDLVWVGRACNGDALLNPLGAGDIAIVRRGACTFAEKSQTVANAGAVAIVISNNNPNSTPWSGLRIWDYSDPVNPVLASIFDTECSASIAPGGSCDPAGTYSSHNVQVESRGNKTFAYVSWYSDGMLVLDVSDPYNPVEVGRYTEPGTDFWGIYKEPNSPFFYGSDRNGGLYIFKEQGSGSGK
ncbi:MAG: hypothetical protein JSV66_18350 [Trueperaceae bacterium]|nr:MAG: hypothetical protein JSV66_18350 [Trueperaceae bacterium]